jgi:uncharacterized protein YggE
VKRLLPAVAALALAAFFAAACGDSDSPASAAPASSPVAGEGPAVISASGLGTVTGTPDVLTVQLGVETSAPRAKDALDDNNNRASALIDTLKQRGVADKDIQTSQLSIYPRYDDQGRRITGYQVNNMVTAKLRDLGGAGALIDAAAETAGDAVRVNSIAFSIDDDSALLATARADAVRRAKAQAEQMAEAAGVKLGKVRSISESGSAAPPMPYPMYAGAPAADAAKSVPIEAGSQELNLTVNVIYEIAQ